MATTITTNFSSYNVAGPFSSLNEVLEASGVYIISTVNRLTGNHDIIDIGESHSIKSRLAAHDRINQWAQHVQEGLYFGAIYCNEQVRMLAEKDLRLHFNPPCGIR